MGRLPRREYEGAWHHVMNRGGCSRDVFLERSDRTLFLAILNEAVQRTDIEVHAYCLMKNHYHLLMRTPEPVLGAALQHLAGKYTQEFNRRHVRDGALFRGRYHSVPITTDEHLLTALRYIHRNPTNDFGIEPDDYEWSSHRSYSDQAPTTTWLQTSFLLSLTGGALGYAALVNSPLGTEHVDKILPKTWPDLPESA